MKRHLHPEALDWSTAKAARWLGVSVRQVYRLIHRGPLNAYRGAGGRLWIQQADLRALRGA